MCVNPVLGSYPCGKCINCRIQYSATWSARLLHELASWDNHACFVTLTFDDDHIGDNNLNPRDFQLFFKRLRKFLFPCKIKHFTCGEYGDRTQRKHGHSIIYGLDCNDNTKKLLSSVWKNGFVHVGTVTYDSCRYVTDYILKKYNGPKAYAVYGDKTPPFRLMSNGLGKSFFLSDLENFKANDGFFIRGHFRQLPRYYKDLMFKSEDPTGTGWLPRFIYNQKKLFLNYDKMNKAVSDWIKNPLHGDISLRDLNIKLANQQAENMLNKTSAKGGL